MQGVTTVSVQFALNYVPQCFNENAPYSVLSRFIIIKSMVFAFISFSDIGWKLLITMFMKLCR